MHQLDWKKIANELHESLHGVYDEWPINKHNVERIEAALKAAFEDGKRAEQRAVQNRDYLRSKP